MEIKLDIENEIEWKHLYLWRETDLEEGSI